MIVGIAGTLGAGKGTVVEYLKEKGFGHYSVSGYMGEILAERGLPKTREHLSALADELAREYEGGILEVMYNKAQQDSVSNYILESIHRVSEADYVRSVGGFVLTIDADVRTRYERTQTRQEGEKDAVTFEEFLAAIEREEKGQGSGLPNINQVMQSADHKLTNDGTLDELHAQIEQWLTQVQE